MCCWRFRSSHDIRRCPRTQSNSYKYFDEGKLWNAVFSLRASSNWIHNKAMRAKELSSHAIVQRPSFTIPMPTGIDLHRTEESSSAAEFMTVRYFRNNSACNREICCSQHVMKFRQGGITGCLMKVNNVFSNFIKMQAIFCPMKFGSCNSAASPQLRVSCSWSVSIDLPEELSAWCNWLLILMTLALLLMKAGCTSHFCICWICLCIWTVVTASKMTMSLPKLWQKQISAIATSKMHSVHKEIKRK